MPSYTINYSEVGKQHSSLTEQLSELSKVLDEMENIEQTMLTAAQWTADDKKDFTDKFANFMQAGRNLHKAGTSEAEALQKISDAYRSAEQG